MKYKISLKKLYVAEKKGMSSGFGATPEKAFFNAKQRHESVVRKASLERKQRYAQDLVCELDDRISDLSKKNTTLELSNNALRKKIHELENKEIPTRKEWLLYAIAHNGAPDALGAIKRMESCGAIVSKNDIDLAEKVQIELDGFSRAITKNQAKLRVVW